MAISNLSISSAQPRGGGGFGGSCCIHVRFAYNGRGHWTLVDGSIALFGNTTALHEEGVLLYFIMRSVTQNFLCLSLSVF